MLEKQIFTSTLTVEAYLRSFMKRITIGTLALTLISIILPVTAANAGSICNNGTYSSNSGRGTCSYNGGVNKNFPSYSDPYSSSYKRNNGLGSSLDSYGYGSSRNSYGYGSSLNSYGYGSSINSYGYGSKKTCPKYSYFC